MDTTFPGIVFQILLVAKLYTNRYTAPFLPNLPISCTIELTSDSVTSPTLFVNSILPRNRISK